LTRFTKIKTSKFLVGILKIRAKSLIHDMFIALRILVGLEYLVLLEVFVEAPVHIVYKVLG